MHRTILPLSLLLLLSSIAPVLAQNNPLEASLPESVLTQHNDISRTGNDYRETVLNTTNVNPATFGKLFTRAVDGQMYPQPLYVPNLPIPHVGVRNVIFLETDNNSAYAYDADDPAASTPFWHVNFGPPAPSSDFYTPPITDMNENVGITSTPVIDLDRGEIFMESKTKVDGKYHQKLHALNIYTGAEEPGSPVEITATVKAAGYDAVNGVISFSPFTQLQRPGLLLDHGLITVCFGSHGDHFQFHGWVMQYTEDLKQVNVFCSTPTGSDGEGSFWMAGQGAAADPDGNIYVSAGNGATDARTGGPNYSQSILRLNFSKPGNPVMDFFTPYNADQLNKNDSDLGSCGLFLVPNTHLILTGSKTGMFYLIDRDNMGHYHPNDDNEIVQSFQAGWGHIHGSPVYYDDAGKNQYFYAWSENDHLRQYHFINGKINETPVSLSPNVVPHGMPGGILAVSSDHNKSGTGIIWATHAYDGDANWLTQEGLFQAFDARDVSKELWNSKMNEARDDMGNFAKFCPPTIANGKIYLSTFSNQLVVYGLLPKTAPTH